MALSEYKFYTPVVSETDEQAVERLTSEMTELEMIYSKLDSENDTETEEMQNIESIILAKRTEFEDKGGSYPEL